MISLLSNWLGLSLHPQQQTMNSASQILLNDFVDFDLDIIGVYTKGHHDLKNFLAAVRNREPHAKLSSNQVRWAWAKLDGNSLTEFDSPIQGAEPITLFEIYD